ncbi:MAG: hypothetical protein E7317_13295 [Clostridiales bacterium]|nr:hypothetical protein [Clostridiales bacterium]
MKRYDVIRSAEPLPALTGRVFDPEREGFCRAVPCAPICEYPWDESGYRPRACAWMTEDDAGFNVLLAAYEPSIRASATVWNGPVWLDSCLECFLMPIEGNTRYMNVEVNAGGAALMGMGPGREGRALLPEPPEGWGLQVSRHEGGWWAVRYRISFALIEALFGAAPQHGRPMRANFYCCDESIHPHFGAWNPIAAPKPDFHRPECFGTLART